MNIRQGDIDLEHLADAAIRLLHKFHHETDCGQGEDGLHWAECERVVDALGFERLEEILPRHASPVTYALH